MIKFYDPSGESYFGQATITRKTSVNGGLSLTGEVFAGDDVLNGLDYGWWLNFDNEKYVITYKKLSDDTNTIVFDAVQQFFWDFAKVALHSQYTGSHEYTFYLNQLFNGSGYTYNNDAIVPAFEKENWGYKNKLSLFNDIMDQADVEFEVHNERVHIAKQIGSDLTSFVRKGINLSDLTEEMKISDFATYAKGYGAFKDSEDPSQGRLEVEYRSELAKLFGDLEMDPIVDERYTVADNLIAELKKQVDATYTVSMTMNIYDLENAGYPNYESPKVGDWILAIDEALNFKRKVRIIKLEEQFDATGKRIGYTATCGDLSIVDQYTNIQSSLDSKVQRIQKSVDDVAVSANGKSKNYYGAKEPISANEGDLWFDQSNSDPDKWSIKQWANGRWEQLTLNPGEVDAKVSVAKQAADTAIGNSNTAVENANKAVSQAGFANDAADQAKTAAANAQDEASSAFAKADSAVANALNAQSDASNAVIQASSAAADSKDAKQIAGAVSQSYKTLTDGSTMTVAELESGLAAKLTRTDLDGYATETWAQNQISATANGINGMISSVKSTVDGQTTSINDLKADSSSFKSQFTTVNNTLGKQTTDIGTLQASSKELTSGFNTLTTDNKTNKNDISQLKQTATEVTSTLETVQTQVQDSAVGTNLLTGTGNHTVTGTGTNDYLSNETEDDFLSLLQGLEGETITLSVDYEYSGFVAGSSRNRLGWEANIHADTITYFGPWYYPDNDSGSGRIFSTFVVPKNITSIGYAAGYIEFSGSGTGTLSHLKLEKGSLATDWTPAPEDMATVTAFSKLSQTVDAIQGTVANKTDQSQVTQLANQVTSVVSTADDNSSQIIQLSKDINLRVKTGDLISQINVSAGNVLIQSGKLYLDAASVVMGGTAFINAANIKSVNASTITTGTLDAATVNVVNLNASNITTGAISGANLSINLTTGEVLFQKGSIKSTNGNLNIDIDNGNMEVVNSVGSGFRFQNGGLYLTDKSWSWPTPTYGSITYSPSLFSNMYGIAIKGAIGASLSSNNYDTASLMWQHQPTSGAAVSLMSNDALLNARERAAVEGGNLYSESGYYPNTSRATIVVGGNNGDGQAPTDQYGKYHLQDSTGVGSDAYIKGTSITFQGGDQNGLADLNLGSSGGRGHVSSAAIYNRTYSSGDHVVITGYGILGRLTSARKYKIADQVATGIVAKAQRVLSINPAEWYDKAEIESIADAKTNGTEAPGEAKIEKHYGFIADDFDAAGLTEVVNYHNGEVDSLSYDHISMYHHVILQNHEKRIAELEAEVEQLKGEI